MTAMQFNSNQVSYGAMETAPTNPFNQQPAGNNMFNNQMPQQQMPNPQNPFNNPAAAMAGPSPANPFANANMYPDPTTAEQVQPYPTDPYMHGNNDQRGFNNY